MVGRGEKTSTTRQALYLMNGEPERQMFQRQAVNENETFAGFERTKNNRFCESFCFSEIDFTCAAVATAEREKEREHV